MGLPKRSAKYAASMGTPRRVSYGENGIQRGSKWYGRRASRSQREPRRHRLRSHGVLAGLWYRCSLVWCLMTLAQLLYIALLAAVICSIIEGG